MSASRSSLLPGPNHAVLRWSETPYSPSREEPVDIVQARPAETLIRSALQVTEKTRVYLIKNGYTRIGIVKSCWADCGLFLVQIATVSSGSLGLAAKQPADPGALAVDDFVTEEEEAEILGNLGPVDDNAARRFLPEEMEARIAWQVMADLRHLLRAISCNSTEAGRLPFRRPLTVH